MHTRFVQKVLSLSQKEKWKLNIFCCCNTLTFFFFFFFFFFIKLENLILFLS